MARPPIPRPVSGDRLPMPMRICKARVIALGHQQAHLGQPSKLPGFSYGIDGYSCIRGSELAMQPGSVCGECYARKNFYNTWLPVRVSRERRQEAIKHPQWCDAMVSLIIYYTDPAGDYFRWHDSGDLMGSWHLGNIIEVCRRTPWVKHWLPTHEPWIVRDRLMDGDSIPDNLCIRVSADFIGRRPAVIMGLDVPTSTVHRVRGRPVMGIECRSYTRADEEHGVGVCGRCRNCWNPRISNISYPLH